MTAPNPFSPSMTAFRVWQALEPRAVVEALPLDTAFEECERATAPGSNATAGILGAQAIGLNIVACRLFEMAADAQDDWPKFSCLIDLALRAQEQSRKAIEAAHPRHGGNGDG